MILEQGEKVLVVHRRMYADDHQRFFIGTVDGYEDGVVKVTGYTWVRDVFHSAPAKKNGLRTKIFSIASGTLMVYELPESLDLSKLIFESNEAGQLDLCDGQHFKLDMSEGRK